jgi:ribosome biogenesis GTPase A
LTLPPSEFAKIRKAVYISSSVDLKGCPPQTMPEFAVIGRSNVGKSSLINMLTQSNKLAKVSKQPGEAGVQQQSQHLQYLPTPVAPSDSGFMPGACRYD